MIETTTKENAMTTFRHTRNLAVDPNAPCDIEAEGGSIGLSWTPILGEVELTPDSPWVHKTISMSEAIANARLWAAAPDLLEAVWAECARLFNPFEPDNQHERFYKLDKLIEQATGQHYAHGGERP
jgi:hypothetical protein